MFRARALLRSLWRIECEKVREPRENESSESSRVEWTPINLASCARVSDQPGEIVD